MAHVWVNRMSDLRSVSLWRDQNCCSGHFQERISTTANWAVQTLWRHMSLQFPDLCKIRLWRHSRSCVLLNNMRVPYEDHYQTTTCPSQVTVELWIYLLTGFSKLTKAFEDVFSNHLKPFWIWSVLWFLKCFDRERISHGPRSLILIIRHKSHY